MAIRNYDGDRLTPKQFAKMVFCRGLEIITDYWYERFDKEYRAMTEREVALVDEQMDKLADRIYRMVE